MLGLWHPLRTPSSGSLSSVPLLFHPRRCYPPASPPPLHPPPRGSAARERARPAPTRNLATLLLYPTTLQRLVLSCGHGSLSESFTSLRRHRDLTLMSAPFFTPGGDVFWFWDAERHYHRHRRGYSATFVAALSGSSTTMSPHRECLFSLHCPHCGRPERSAATVLGPP